MSDATDHAIREGIDAATKRIIGNDIDMYPAWLDGAVEEIRRRLPTPSDELSDEALGILKTEFTKRVQNTVYEQGCIIQRRRKAPLKALATAIPVWVARLEQIHTAITAHTELIDIQDALCLLDMGADVWAEIVADNGD